MNREIVLNKINNIITQIKEIKSDVEEDCPIGIISMNNWEWAQGVGLFSLYLYYKETGEKEILEYLVRWFDDKIKEGIPEKNINTTCPMLTLIYLYEETNNEKYLNMCIDWVRYIINNFPRTEEGGLQHVVSGLLNEGQLWDDTLYMTVLFIGKMGVFLKDDNLVQESIRQFLVHLKYLTDPKTGLFFHGWTFDGKHHFAKALWGRGNSWYTAGLVDYLDIVELPGGVEEFLLTSLQRQIKKLSEVQTETGMWRTLLLDEDSYEETSATSAFAYGILKAVRNGYIDREYKEIGMKALQAIINRVDENGIVQGVSYGTGCKMDLDYYRNIEICPMPYGQSMALLALLEGIKHIN